MKLLHELAIGIILWGAFIPGAQASSVEDVTNRSDRDYANRFRASYHIVAQSNQTNIETMLQFLRRAPSEDVVTTEELASLKNNVADVLIEQKNLAPRLLEEFLAMYSRPILGATWRNYVVQKVPAICLQLDDRKLVSRAVDFLLECGPRCEGRLYLRSLSRTGSYLFGPVGSDFLSRAAQ